MKIKITKEIGYDKRVRFGWTDDFDLEPQLIREMKIKGLAEHPVAVIPLPFMSAKIRQKIRNALKGIVWPE
jgi:hypothetical protein